eukprot:scaffold70391_cov66-Phaeocystis_antarctica.AAC.2
MARPPRRCHFRAGASFLGAGGAGSSVDGTTAEAIGGAGALVDGAAAEVVDSAATVAAVMSAAISAACAARCAAAIHIAGTCSRVAS